MQTKVERVFNGKYAPLARRFFFLPWKRIVRHDWGYELKQYSFWSGRDTLDNKDDAEIRCICFEYRWKKNRLTF